MSFVTRILDALASVVAPLQCVACDEPCGPRELESLASPALSIPNALCPNCRTMLEASAAREARSTHTVAGVRVVAVAPYAPPWSLAVGRFKYQGRTNLAAPLGSLLGRALSLVNVRADVVVPVPLHRGRLVHRGYNQSALLARIVGPMLSFRCHPRALSRVRDTGSLALLGGRDRPAAVAEAFVARADLVTGLEVLLIDDVVTTGATIRECRRAIDRVGGRVVAVGALATGAASSPVAGLHEM